MRFSNFQLSFIMIAVVAMAGVLTQCGVKGPPLPPIPSTPMESDRMERAEPSPSPSPAVPSST